MNNDIVTIPAGRYFLGDPCYCFGKSWGEVLNETNFFQNETHEFRDFPIVAFGTAHGDGEYFDQKGNRFPVDAGLIGLVHENLIETKDPNWLSKAGIWVESVGETECWKDGGDLNFGDICIETDPQYEDD